jgi:NAD(P)-dependent dehydrogenase (short-subunit alcohol dehydrogenase family)
MSWEGKLVVITGAANGIGAGLAQEAARRGARVLLGDRDAQGLAKIAEEIASAETMTLDVSAESEMDAFAECAVALGGADLFFNNAGIMRVGLSWEIPKADWDLTFAVNVGGVVNGIRSFVPRMIARGAPSRIVNTASVGGFMPSPIMAPYSATKFAVVAITEGLHHELAMVGAPVSVSLLAPGPVNTAIMAASSAGEVHPATQAFMHTMNRMMSEHGMAPQAFARLVFEAIDLGAYWIVPQPEALDPGLARRNAMIKDRAPPSFGL